MEVYWVDGITCILATLLLIKVLNPRVAKPVDNIVVKNPVSVYKDKPFWIFFVAMFIFGLIFLQYFSTMPLYYKEIHALTEFEIGVLLGMNGFFIFLLEMPLIKWLEDSKFTKIGLMLFGLLLTALSFYVLNLTSWIGILLIGMLLMTIGEMIAFPFSNAFAMDRAKKGKQGQYLSMYVMAFSIAHIFGHNIGLRLVDNLGYNNTWYIMLGLGFIGVLLLIYLKRVLKNEVL